MHSHIPNNKRLPHPNHPRHPLNQIRKQGTSLKSLQRSESIDLLKKAHLWLLTQKGLCNKANQPSPVYRQPSIIQGINDHSSSTTTPVILHQNTPIASQTNYLSIQLPSLLKAESLPLRQVTNQLTVQQPKSTVSGGFRPFKRQNTCLPQTQTAPSITIRKQNSAQLPELPRALQILDRLSTLKSSMISNLKVTSKSPVKILSQIMKD